MNKIIVLLLGAAFVLSACGQDDDERMSPSSDIPPEGAPMDNTKTEFEETMTLVDHTLDEVEFDLRRSIGAIERRIETYKEEGFNTAELEAELKELRKELEKVVEKNQ